jgi:putative OPT family oligopeptide transporter
MKELKGQLTLRGVVIGCVGCAVITASSIYTALKMGALPWPIVFAALISLVFLKAISRGRASLNEANVTHTVMSSGAMVAGGLAFTIPGAWMLGLTDSISTVQLVLIAICGSAVGLIGSVMLRKYFVEDTQLEFPIGEAAAQTLVAGEKGGSVGKKLFGSMGVAAVYTLLRDKLALLPSMLFSANIPGVTFGIYNSPMSLAVGFLVGTGAVCVWFAGAVLSNFGIIVGGSAAGFWDTAGGQSIVSSLGMGVMMGCGVAVIVKDIIPKGIGGIKARMSQSKVVGLTAEGMVASQGAGKDSAAAGAGATKRGAMIVALLALIAAVCCMFLGLPPIVSVLVVLLTFVTCAMSAQSVGQTGIDPMEIFGLIVLLLVAAFAQMPAVQLFFIAAVVAVACGLAGDVMNDFRAGYVLGTSPKAQWVGQAIGAVVGSIVAVLALQVLLSAYGPDAFGTGAQFVAAQASVVASMVTGVPSVPAFVLGLVAGFVLQCVGFPAMMFGLGIYLPFYMSLTAFVGAMIKVVFNQIKKFKHKNLTEEERAAKDAKSEETALVVATGLLGGESIMGIILALIVTGTAFFAA